MFIRNALTAQPGRGEGSSTQDASGPGRALLFLLNEPSIEVEDTLLTVTEQAASMIQELLDHADLPEGAGLRIAQRDDHTALAMTLADAASDADLIVADRNISVFLGPMAARRVDSQTLDATSSDTRAAFYLRD